MSAWNYAQCAYEEIERAYLLDTCPYCRASLNQHDPDMDDGRLGYFTEVWVGICQLCGWWNARGEARERVDAYTEAVYELGSFGVLKNLDLKNIKTPLQEVRDYLTVKMTIGCRWIRSFSSGRLAAFSATMAMSRM